MSETLKNNTSAAAFSGAANTIPEINPVGQLLVFSNDFGQSALAGKKILLINKGNDRYQGIVLNLPIERLTLGEYSGKECIDSARDIPVICGGDFFPETAITLTNRKAVHPGMTEPGRINDEIVMVPGGEDLEYVRQGVTGLDQTLVACGHCSFSEEGLRDFLKMPGCHMIDGTRHAVFTDIGAQELINKICIDRKGEKPVAERPQVPGKMYDLTAAAETSDLRGKLLVISPLFARESGRHDVYYISQVYHSSEGGEAYRLLRINGASKQMSVEGMAGTHQVNVTRQDIRALTVLEGGQVEIKSRLRAIIKDPEDPSLFALYVDREAIEHILDQFDLDKVLLFEKYDVMRQTTLEEYLVNGKVMIMEPTPEIMFHPDPSKKWEMACNALFPLHAFVAPYGPQGSIEDYNPRLHPN